MPSNSQARCNGAGPQWPQFDPKHGDVDFFVEFDAQTQDLFDAYFGLKEDLEALLGRPVDLVMANAVTNPYFAKSASRPLKNFKQPESAA